MLTEYCFHDPDVIDLVRKQWRASALLSLSDDYGSRLPLLEMPRQLGRHLVSPYEAGVVLAAKPPAEIRTSRLLGPLVDRLLAEVEGQPNLLVEIQIPLDLLEVHGHAILEPFLLARFTVALEFWERSVDLSLDPLEILHHAHNRVRQALRRGLAEAPAIRFFHGEALPEPLLREFFQAAVHTRQASGTSLRHDYALYAEDRAALVLEGKAVLGVCEHKGYRGYLLALASRALGYWWDGAWSGERSAFANFYLQYRMMLFLKELGVRRYSLGYVFPDLLAASGKASNIAFFKDGFGDELRPVYTVTLSRESRGVRLARGLIRGPVGGFLRRLPGLGGR
jgi:hypothetical protein